MSYRWVAPLPLIVTLISAGFTQNPQAHISTIPEIQEDFQNVPCRPKDRPSGVQALFEKMGAPADSLSVEKFQGVENLVLRRDSGSQETIVIGAHYDYAERGCGAVDNWTGIVTLAHLYRTISMLPVHKTVLFVAFGNEERGLLGSNAMVRTIPKQNIPNYCAMINVDSFGLARPFAMENSSSTGLLAQARKIAEELKLPFDGVPIPGADADSSSFKAAGIPAITLSGVSNDWRMILHTSNDQASKVIPSGVYLGYRMALSLWNSVDTAPCEAFRAR